MSDQKPVADPQQTVMTNLIVNYLPQTLSDDEFKDLFDAYGTVLTARVIRDKNTGYSYGYGFVDFEKAEDAAKAIGGLDKFKIQHKMLKVAYSKPSGTQTKNINLYVSGLSAEVDEESIRTAFSKYGDIVQCNVIKDKVTQLCQGICFVLFSCRDQAETAIRAMSGEKVEGLGDKPVTIKFARNDQRSESYSFLQNFTKSQTNLLPNPNRSMMPPPMGGGGGGFNGASPIRGMRIPKERYSPIMPGGHQHHHYPPAAAVGGNYYSGSVAAAQLSFPGHNAGNGDQSTRGKVVFVYGIGPYTNENMLRELFGPAGRVINVSVIYDTSRGMGKGYGFVTFETEKEAIEAVRCLDKVSFQGRMLQVSIKT